MASFMTWNVTVTTTWSELHSPSQSRNTSFVPSINSTSHAWDQTNITVYICFFSLVLLLGISGNAIALWHIIKSKKLSSATDVLLLDLTISNLSVIVASTLNIMAFTIHVISVQLFNNFILLLYTINLYANPPFMACIAVDQYIAVVHPIRSQAWRKRKYYVALSIATWLAVFTLSLVEFFIKRTVSPYSVPCTEMVRVWRLWEILLFVSEVIVFAIPVLILLICYFLTSKKLLEMGKGKESMRLMKKKVLMTIGGILTVLLFCFAPYHVPELYFRAKVLLDPSSPVTVFYRCNVEFYTWVVTSFSAFLNPLLYIFRSQNFNWRPRCCFV
ncbi:G-protein coupled receptor 183-B-like [Scyliorhinus canicula]|uniref:G-protein coupled receptor 183-B-like n=1 Tax=Scyliorhinus canicula TaxID=7830 RepID=UPI0018F63B96|nr:G-protein coupled receptor 183-B-like [Scyliorhinus canicula]